MRTPEIPGFVDLQINGFRGVDFSSPDLTGDAFMFACRELRSAGTAAFLPTILTSPIDVYQRNLPLMAELIERRENGLNALGFHLEGPFISTEEGARGIHNPSWVVKPDVALFDQLQHLSHGMIRMITIAAETEGASDLARHAVSQGTVVSLGHQLASEREMKLLKEAGALSLTHFGNGIPVSIHRHRNPLWAGLAMEELTAMIITDGHHIPESIVRIILGMKGVDKTVVVSDSSPLAGLEPGRYTWMGVEVILEEDGYLHEAQGPYLAGSSATMLQCMNYLASLRLLDLEDLIQIGFYNPLRIISTKPPRTAEESVVFEQKKGVFTLTCSSST